MSRTENERARIDEQLIEYLDEREADGTADWTIRSHRNRLSKFVGWCEGEGVEFLDELEPTHIRGFKQWRQETLNSKSSVKTQMDTLRVFVKWCEDYNLLPGEFHKSVRSPSLEYGENVRDESISTGRCERIMERLESYHYASREHVVFALAFHGTLRRGSIHSLDVSDVQRGEGRLRLRHRPSDGTRLKNKIRSERVINVSDEVMGLLCDWIDDQRPEVTDEEGREPLVSTKSGRAHLNTIASDIYYVSKPAFVGEDCGCEREDEDEGWCESSNRTDAYKCESSVSPHTVRGAAITHHLDEGWLIDMVADRADNSADVIREHYDNADEDEQAERRAEFMDLLEDSDDEDEDEDDDEGAAASVSV
jgi:site-specific recombinase XerD